MVVVALFVLHLVHIQQDTAEVLRSWQDHQIELLQHHTDSYILADSQPFPRLELKLAIERLSEVVACTVPTHWLPGTAVTTG